MTVKLDDVWATRDFPLLVAIMRQVETEGLPAQPYDLDIDLPEEDRHRGLRALAARGLVTIGWRGMEPDEVKTVSGQAYMLTGLHPDGEDLRERLVSVLEQMAERVDDEDDASAFRKTARQVGTLSRDAIAGLAAALAAGQIMG